MEKRILCIALTVIFLNTNTLRASEQDRIAELEKKFETMQSAYESKIKSLESRIVELESKETDSPTANVSEPPAVSAPMQRTATGNVPAALPEPPEAYSVEWMRQYADAVDAIRQQQNQRIQKENDDWGFEFHGYLRSGFGINGYGNTMAAFQAPGSGAKYRLGNEAETYLETTFLTRMPKSLLPEGLTFDTQITAAYVIPHDQSNSANTQVSLREAFGIVRGVWEDKPTAAFWAGQRFYSRYDVHMNDFYYRDMSGYGGGVEDIPIWDDSAMLSIAYLGGSTDDLDSSGTKYDEDDYQLNMNTIDVGLTEMDMFGGKVALYGTFSDFNGDVFRQSSTGNVLVLADSQGLAGNLIYDLDLTEDITNRFAFQYGQGAAANFRALMVAPTGLISTGNEVIDVDDFEKLRILNSIILDDGSPWSYEGLLVYESGDYGTPGSSRNKWLSAGFRPVYHFNRFWSLAFEAGIDYTDNDRGGRGTLGKLTIAPQISPDSKQMSRPVLRAFLTYAWWADDFEGRVGGIDYADNHSGITAGLQLETWW